MASSGGSKLSSQTLPGVSHVQTHLDGVPGLVSRDGHATLIRLSVETDAQIKPVVSLVQATNGHAGLTAAITGEHTVGNDFTTLSQHDLSNAELAFGLPAALVVLVLVFGSIVSGLVPVVLALLSILVGMGLVALLSLEFRLSVFVVNMLTGMGLALGIDYSLFVLSRFREERGRGHDTLTAIERSGASASRAVLFSGSTFVVAMFGMLLVQTSIMRSLAAGAIVVGVVSVAAALTLLPALLSLLGDRVEAGRVSRLWRRRRAPSQPDRGREPPVGSDRRPGPQTPRAQPRTQRDADAARGDARPRPAHRIEWRLHAAGLGPRQAGLREARPAVPEPEPLPGPDRALRRRPRGPA